MRDGIAGELLLTSLLAVPARTWAVDCAKNEILVIQHPGSYLRYRLHEVGEKGDQVRDQIETPEGSVARLILRDGRPLTSAEDTAERDRLNGLIASPGTFTRHIRREQENKKDRRRSAQVDAGRHALELHLDGQPKPPGSAGDRPAGEPPQVVIDFVPNTKMSPPDMQSEHMTCLKGRVWIDSQYSPHGASGSQPVSRREYRLGHGCAHLSRAGLLRCTRSMPGATVAWIVEHIVEQLSSRALMVKNVKQRLVFDTSGFSGSFLAMGYQQAIKTLLDTPLPSH